jgi:hypothetical protein
MRTLKNTRVAGGLIVLLVVTAAVLASRQAVAQQTDPKGGAAPVSIVSPDPVRVSEAPSEPVHFSGSCNTTINGNGCTVHYPVPAGKRLVIEYVSHLALSLPPEAFSSMRVESVVGGVEVEHQLPPTAVATVRNVAFVAGTGQAVRLYADPETFVALKGVHLNGLTAKDASFTFTFSGYLLAVE